MVSSGTSGCAVQAALRERGLPGSGTKAELVERLEEAFAEEEGDDGDEADSDGEWATDEDGEDAVPLEEWLKEDLRVGGSDSRTELLLVHARLCEEKCCW